MDDLNIVVLAGHLATEPDLQHFATGDRRLRLRLSVVSEGPPRRVEVLPVTMWQPPPGAEALPIATPVTVGGIVRRRFRATPGGRTSTVEIVADQLWWSTDGTSDDGRTRDGGRYPPRLP